jgi:hypothetical protein
MKTTNKFFLSRKSQAGISNIQIMVGVLISAILILGGIGLIRYIDKSKVNNDLSELSELKGRTVAYGSAHGGNFAGFTQELAVGLDFFPANRVSGSTGSRTVSNQWKGTITVAPTISYVANDSLLFTYSGVPSSACKELVLQAESLAAVIVVNGQYAKSASAPINDANVVAFCDANGDNASVGYTMTK